MTGQKREREVERARYERQQARRIEKRQKAKRRERIIASVVVAVLAVGGFVYLGNVLRGNGSDTASDDSTPATTEKVCASLNGVSPAAKTYEQPPPYPLNPDKDYSLTLGTNCGDLKIALFADKAPKNVSNLLGLSKAGFYDNTICHRLTTSGIYVLQCGDPQGTGQGGPGYKLPDENLPKKGTNNYPTGTVAMANSGPDTNGSQFFIVYGDSTLSPDYTIVGKLSEGLSTLLAVGAQGTIDGTQDGPPKQPVQILSTAIHTAKAKAG